MLDVVRLSLLRELAHRGTMTAVADACGYSSSAISQQLAALQREAGVTLYERVGRRVQLTAEGARLAAHAEAVLSALEEAEADLRKAQDPRGRLAVASFATMGARLIPAIVAAQRMYPDLHVIVHELEPAEAIDALRAGRCELAFTYTYNLVPESAPPGLRTRPVYSEPVLLALPASHPAARACGPHGVDLHDLRAAEWIAGSRGTADHDLAERACAMAGYQPDISHTADDYTLVLRMVRHGLGVAFVPALAAPDGPPEGVALLPVRALELARHAHALTRPATAAIPAVLALMTFVMEPAASREPPLTDH